MIESYVQDGRAKLEFKYLPLPQFEPEASTAAQAAECAADQGQFWPMHDYIFDVASSQGRGGLRNASLIDAAEELGMNRDDYSECLNGAAHTSTVQASRTEASGVGVSSTPTVFINGVQMPNAFDIDAISAEIERIAAGS